MFHIPLQHLHPHLSCLPLLLSLAPTTIAAPIHIDITMDPWHISPTDDDDGDAYYSMTQSRRKHVS